MIFDRVGATRTKCKMFREKLVKTVRPWKGGVWPSHVRKTLRCLLYYSRALDRGRLLCHVCWYLLCEETFVSEYTLRVYFVALSVLFSIRAMIGILRYATLLKLY